MTPADLARAIGGGALALLFVLVAVAAIVWNEMREKAKAKRNLEAQCDALRAAAVQQINLHA